MSELANISRENSELDTKYQQGKEWASFYTSVGKGVSELANISREKSG